MTSAVVAVVTAQGAVSISRAVVFAAAAAGLCLALVALGSECVTHAAIP